MKQFLSIICLSILTLGTVSAQEAVVKGRVVDTYSSDPIPDVALRILNSVFSTETDQDGLFSFTANDLPQGEQVLIFADGLVSVSVFIVNSDSDNLSSK